ncbi:MAG: NHLP-related RiPP peptide [Tahibacter sp.]
MATQESARRLLQQLAEDDVFRARALLDPVGVSAEFGFTLDAAKLPVLGARLPSKADIVVDLEKLGERLTAAQGIVVFKA